MSEAKCPMCGSRNISYQAGAIPHEQWMECVDCDAVFGFNDGGSPITDPRRIARCLRLSEYPGDRIVMACPHCGRPVNEYWLVRSQHCEFCGHYLYCAHSVNGIKIRRVKTPMEREAPLCDVHKGVRMVPCMWQAGSTYYTCPKCREEGRKPIEVVEG